MAQIGLQKSGKQVGSRQGENCQIFLGDSMGNSAACFRRGMELGCVRFCGSFGRRKVSGAVTGVKLLGGIMGGRAGVLAVGGRSSRNSRSRKLRCWRGGMVDRRFGVYGGCHGLAGGFFAVVAGFWA